MIKAVRETEIILGKKKNLFLRAREKKYSYSPKVTICKKNIEKGEKFSPQNLICLRPGTGISPMKIDTVFKKRAKKNFLKGQIIKI